MKKTDFTVSGGYPLTQDSLRFMQEGYMEALRGLGLAFNVFGTYNTEVIILAGVELSVSGGSLHWTEGYVVWKGGETMHVPASSITYSPAQLHLNRVEVPDPVLDPTYYALTSQVNDSHLITTAVLSYTPAANPADTAPLMEERRVRNIMRYYANPLGSVIAFAGNTLPPGWAECNGSLLNYNTNPEYYPLWLVLQNLHGTGPSAGDFRLPDLRDRFVLGAGTSLLADSGGSAEVTLAPTNLPPHTHTIGDSGVHRHTFKMLTTKYVGVNAGGGEEAANPDVSAGYDQYTDYDGNHNHGGATGAGPGTSEPVDVMNPYYTLKYIIRVV